MSAYYLPGTVLDIEGTVSAVNKIDANLSPHFSMEKYIHNKKSTKIY